MKKDLGRCHVCKRENVKLREYVDYEGESRTACANQWDCASAWSYNQKRKKK